MYQQDFLITDIKCQHKVSVFSKKSRNCGFGRRVDMLRKRLSVTFQSVPPLITGQQQCLNLPYIFFHIYLAMPDFVNLPSHLLVCRSQMLNIGFVTLAKTNSPWSRRK